MRLLYVAPFEHAWGTEEHVARAFEALGHEVTRVNECSERLFDEVMDACTDARVMLYTKGYGLPPTWAKVWQEIEARGCQTASHHLDLYVGLKRQAQIYTDPFWKTGTVFTADGGHQEFFASHQINHQWLPPAVSHEGTYEGQWRAEYDHDVVFVGSGSYHREWPWRQTLIRALTRMYGPRFKHYDHHPPIRGNDLNDLYATARVVVGDSLALPGHRNYFSDRYFETVGRGGFLLAPNVPGIEDFFTNGEHLALYDIGDIDGLIAKIDWYLERDTRRIAAAGQAHVRKHHTYIQRAEQMLSILGLAVAA